MSGARLIDTAGVAGSAGETFLDDRFPLGEWDVVSVGTCWPCQIDFCALRARLKTAQRQRQGFVLRYWCDSFIGSTMTYVIASKGVLRNGEKVEVRILRISVRNQVQKSRSSDPKSRGAKRVLTSEFGRHGGAAHESHESSPPIETSTQAPRPWPFFPAKQTHNTMKVDRSKLEGRR